MQVQEKSEEKGEKDTGELLRILDLKSSRLQVKAKHSAGKKYQNLAVYANKLLTYISFQDLRIVQQNHATY